jgi:tetraacyldisaccharide 4'-kinase
LLAGIANPYPLELYLKDRCARLQHLYFPDHHRYTKKDIVKITRVFNKILSKKKIIVTTEKDMVRLFHPDLLELIRYLPICFVPIAVEIHEEDRDPFKKKISEYVKNH